MSDSYLEIAEQVISRIGTPLHPKEITAYADEHKLWPAHLRGKTMYKTLAARLSTDIVECGKKSKFFRTGPNLFFIRRLAEAEHGEFRAPKREKTLHNEEVLVVGASFLENHKIFGLIPDAQKNLEYIRASGSLQYLVRKDAENRTDVKQVISYVIVWNGTSVLSYRRGTFTNAADELVGMRSIGFGGHVDREDLDLFSTDGLGVLSNARRELQEELQLNNCESERLQNDEYLRIKFLINTDESSEAQKHLAVVLVFFASHDYAPEKNELSINDLRWLPVTNRINNLDDFEPWSQLLLQIVFDERYDFYK